jgi:hypothetical protein
MPEYEEDDEYEDEELERVVDPRAETSPELILALTRPVVKKEHSRFVSRDLAVTFIPKNKDEYIILARKYISIIMDFNFLSTKAYPTENMADVYNADLKAMLNLLRSIDGFERKQQVTERKIKTETGGEKKRWGLKK